MNRCVLKRIVKQKNIVKYLYDIEGEWKRYFAVNEEYYIEYDMNIEDIPDSVLSIPFIGNIVVMASLFGAQIQVKDIDKDFLESIPEFMEGYKNMYPELNIDYSQVVSYENVISNSCKKSSTNAMLLFSGGVDAYSSLISHEEEKPLLVTICGADVSSDNENAWQKIIDNNNQTAENHGLPIVTIKSSFRKILRNDLLDEWSFSVAGDNWWYLFHHSVAMMTMTSPYAYTNDIAICYFASTYSVNTGGGYKIASDPSIDNYVKFCGCQIVHDGFEFSRHE
ncbi:MAG: hypothetical protein II312_12010, partial [Lachnospiraceae bacterium]|nr:hypothetical protein [Lachnospiraceae bacterium]